MKRRQAFSVSFITFIIVTLIYGALYLWFDRMQTLKLVVSGNEIDSGLNAVIHDGMIMIPADVISGNFPVMVRRGEDRIFLDMNLAFNGSPDQGSSESPSQSQSISESPTCKSLEDKYNQLIDNAKETLANSENLNNVLNNLEQQKKFELKQNNCN